MAIIWFENKLNKELEEINKSFKNLSNFRSSNDYIQINLG